MKSRVAVVGALLFCSGLCALIYQVAWLREFRLVFGGSTAASAAVLAIFMGGLGFGNLVLGRLADRHPNPILLYGWIEAFVALGAAVSPFLIDFASSAYIAVGGQSNLGFLGATVVRLVLSTGVLAIPTFLMGGTLPAAAKAVTTSDDVSRLSAATLYGSNTLGAVIGAVATTFLLLPMIGTRATLWAACGLNLAIAIMALRLARRPLVRPASRQKKPVSTAANGPKVSARPTARARRRSPAVFIYFSSALVGFGFFLMELVWFRMLGPILGGTTYTFGLIISVALLGIGLGGLLHAVIFKHFMPTLQGFALTCTLEAALLALPLALGDDLALLAAKYQIESTTFLARVEGWTCITAIVVLPAAVISGIQFPLLVSLLGEASDRIGRQLGTAFALNTAGAILGSLAGGFGLLPLLTAPGTWRLVVVLLAVLGTTAGLLAWRRENSRRTIAGLSLLAVGLTVYFLGSPGPTAVWRHSGIGAARFAMPAPAANPRREWINQRRSELLWEADGVEASIALVKTQGLAVYVNGKSDGHATGDAGTQIMLGILGGMLHPRARQSLVVGLGTGETAGWLADVPWMERVSVVELEPAVDEMARQCSVVNRDVLNHPRVEEIYNDAREVLLTTRQTYDLIVSEPSNPYRAGIANLFTREFYLAAKSRLNQGGLFVQWLQGYEIDRETVITVFATLNDVFPYVEIWQSKPEDMLLVCYLQPPGDRFSRLRRRVEQEPFRGALRCAWRVDSMEGVLARYVANFQFTRRLAAAPIQLNTDDANRVEYGFARTLGQGDAHLIQRLRAQAVELGMHRPELTDHDDAVVDWDAVDGQRQMFVSFANGEAWLPEDPTPRHRERYSLLKHYWEADMSGLLETWKKSPYEPISPDEAAMIGLACAHLGKALPEPIGRRLRSFQPIDADVIEAYGYFKRGERERAVQKYVEEFTKIRDEPWVFPHAFEIAFPTAYQLARANPSDAARLYEALRRPFAVYTYDTSRTTLLWQIALLRGVGPFADILSQYEPHVPWNQPFLAARRRAYLATNDAAAARRAERDLRQFTAAERGD